MTVALLPSMVIAFLFGFLVLWQVWPHSKSVILIGMMSLPTGFSITSVLYFFWLAVSGGRNGWYPVFESLLLVLLFVFSLKRNMSGSNYILNNDYYQAAFKPVTLIAFLSLAVVTFLSFSIVVKIGDVNAWGYWDAWARDHVKARFLFGGHTFWTWIFESNKIPTHDYPLLLPCTVARSWTWIGSITQRSPQILSIVWSLMSLFILYGTTAWLATPVIGVIVSLGYLTFTPLTFWASAQYADLPLTCYMILACSMMVAAETFPEHKDRYVLLGGFFAGSAAWCKNEGAAFLLALIVWWGAFIIRKAEGRGSACLSFLKGASLAGSAVVILKLAYAGTTGIVPEQQQSLPNMGLLMDSERHVIIFRNFVENASDFFYFFPLLLLIAALTVQFEWQRRSVLHWKPITTAITMGVIYYMVFLTTPLDLQFHLSTAMDRLMLQLWPLILFSCAMLLKPKVAGAGEPCGERDEEGKALSAS